jgi:2'-5' RNA ligase
MRLFIALQLNEAMKDSLMAAEEALRDRCRSGNFSRRENLHLTLAFLGDYPPSALKNIQRIMEKSAAGAKTFSLELSAMGRFRRPGADLWWAGVQNQPALTALAETLCANLRAAGFPLEDRPFAAHLTIARQVDAPGLRPENIPLSSAQQSVTAMSLMESSRVKGVLTYREIFSIPLD